METTRQISRKNYKDTDFTLPRLGLGTMRFPVINSKDADIDYAQVEAMLDYALAHGVNYIDTAYMYHEQKSEVCLGTLLKKYPRDKYLLTDKIPVWYAQTAQDVERIFHEQLDRCQTDHFDFYLIHSVDANIWKTAKGYKTYEFLQRQKERGVIGKLGFSFHDTPEVLNEVIHDYDWDCAQIQMNFLDWSLYRSEEQYNLLTENHIPVIVMEPLRGGALAQLCPDAIEILKKANPNVSAASWGLRWVSSHDNVLCVLSGMSSLEQIHDNVKTYTDFQPLTDAEENTLQNALAEYRKTLAIPCTGCRYCQPCPRGIDIPRIFGLYNQYRISNNKWLFTNNYETIDKDKRAGNCVQCGKCAEHCPQKIDIPRTLKKVKFLTKS